ncbi:Calcium-dependent protein kinase 1 [Aphelenchoides besseyi]|nr:Calcium-dependent protein kinase 1 [Aphelenchoides besseyi]
MEFRWALVATFLVFSVVEAARYRRQDLSQTHQNSPQIQRPSASISPSLSPQSQPVAPQLGFPTSGFVPQFAQVPQRFAQPSHPNNPVNAPPQFVGIQAQHAIPSAAFVNPQANAVRDPSALRSLKSTPIVPATQSASMAQPNETIGKFEANPPVLYNPTNSTPPNGTLTSTTTAAAISLPPVDKNVDLDGDGALSLVEVQYAAFVHHGLSSTVVETLFNQVDKNRDGYLNSVEFNEIRPLVLAKAENAALRYLQNVDVDRNQLLSLSEAQAYILKEYGISNRDVERIWRLVVPSTNDEMDAVLFSKLRRRVRGMSIRLARQIMKTADLDEDGRINLREAQMIAFEQEGIGAGDVIEMLASVDDNNDGELNAPEFADFERIVRARSVDTAKKALKVVDTDGSGTLTMNEAKKIAFDHYGFDERTLEPFFAQADENEDGQLDAVEFAGFRSVIRSRAVKNAQSILGEYDSDGDGRISIAEAEGKANRDDDLEPRETTALFNVADQDRNNYLDKVELADFIRLVRLSAIKYVNDHFRDFDTNRDKHVTVEELEKIVQEKYNVDPTITRHLFGKVDVDSSSDLSAGEIVDFRHEIRKYVADRDAQDELDAQHKHELAEIEAKLTNEKSNETKHRDESNASSNENSSPAETTAETSAPELGTSQTKATDDNTRTPSSDKEAANADDSVTSTATFETTTQVLKTVKKLKANSPASSSDTETETTIEPMTSTQSMSPKPAKMATESVPTTTTVSSTQTEEKADENKNPQNDEEYEVVEVEEVEVTSTTTTTTTTSPIKTVKKRIIKRKKTTTPAPTTTTTTEAPLGSQEEFVEVEVEEPESTKIV